MYCFFNYINKPLRRVFGSILEGRSSLISSLNLHNQNISSIFILFFFVFVVKSAEVYNSALFYVLILSVFLKNPKKMPFFLKKKRCF